jgi:DNA-binding transcriptional MerR regulator
MEPPARIARQYEDQVRLSLSGQRYLTEQQERQLLLEALNLGLSFEEAKRLLAATVAKRRAAREMTLDHDMAVTIETMAGAKGWISRTNFNHAANLYRRLSGGAVGEAEAKSRVKQLMLSRGWKIRGEIIFGTPHWFRQIPVDSAGAKSPL